MFRGEGVEHLINCLFPAVQELMRRGIDVAFAFRTSASRSLVTAQPARGVLQ